MGYLDKAGLSRAFTKLKTLIDNKADVGHTHTKNQVGLGNVDNTADSTKSVKYAASSNYANSAGKANGIVVSDTRNENPAPSSAAFDKQQLTADFKMNNKINSPTGFSGTFCGVLSLAPWADTAGGHGYQLAFGYASTGHPRLALRGSDLSATAWNSWYKIYTSDDKPTLSELGAAAASHSHTKSQITDFAHTHDDRYYTESEINTKLNKKANSSHTHTKSQITDFPTSMPASDVYSWAKQPHKPSYTASEVGAAPASHSHSYLPIAGGTMTGKINRGAGGSWIAARNNVIAFGTTANSGSYNPVVGQKTSKGSWTMGNLTGDERLVFSYDTDTNFNAGNNSSNVTYLPIGGYSQEIITSATIGSQSVSHANTAGSVAWSNVSGRPTIPSVGNGTVTITQNGTKKGSFTLNQSGNATIALTDTNTNTWRPEEVIVSSSRPNASTCKLWIKV